MNRTNRESNDSADCDTLARCLHQLASSIRGSSDRAWSRNAAVRVIDCVLSLNRRYDSFVVPRLDRFEREHTAICSVSDLHALMTNYSSPDDFVVRVLRYRHEERAATLKGVVEWLITVSGGGEYAQQLANLERWANQAQPADHASLRIRGFGLAGFQYLRMLFDANTSKPDTHIRRYVGSCVGHSVSDVQALKLLECAAVKAAVMLRDLDTTIWERSARKQAW